MAVFSTTDRDNIKSALVTAAVEGFASVSVGGQAVQTYSLSELHKLLQMVQQDLASGNARGGLRMVKTIPPEAG